MARINDFEFNIAMKIAANRCLDEDVKEFMNLSTENTVVSPRVEKRVVRKLRFDEWKHIRRISAKTLKYAAIIIVSAVSLFFAAAMTIQPIRAAFIDAIVTWYEDFVDVRYNDEAETADEEVSESESESENDFVIAKPRYLPEGWSITYEEMKNGLYLCNITNSDIGFVHYTQNKDYTNGLGIDNDVCEAEIIYLKNDTVEANLFILEDKEYILVWKEHDIFTLTSENIELHELIKIADSVE